MLDQPVLAALWSPGGRSILQPSPWEGNKWNIVLGGTEVCIPHLGRKTPIPPVCWAGWKTGDFSGGKRKQQQQQQHAANEQSVPGHGVQGTHRWVCRSSGDFFGKENIGFLEWDYQKTQQSDFHWRWQQTAKWWEGLSTRWCLALI